MASGLGLADAVLVRTYVTWDTVPQLAMELDPACTILLFTGRVPYTVASNRGGLQAALDFIPHDGADLFRALIRVLRDHAGRLPPTSLDTIDRSAVDETYLDLDLQPPSALLALDDAVRAPGEWRASDVTAFHEERYRSGEVELCLTCMGPVHDELGRRGVPALRVDHTRAALREALRRASLTDRLARTEASQIAVALVDVREDGRPGPRPDPYEAQRDELRLQARVLDLAERLQGTLSRASDGSYLIHTTRGAVTAELSARDARADDGSGSEDGLSVGYGVGATVARAEEHARQASAIGRQTGGQHIVLDDGTVLAFSDRRVLQRFRLRETDPGLIAHARSVRAGPTLARATRHCAGQARSICRDGPRSRIRLWGRAPVRPADARHLGAIGHRGGARRQVGSPSRPTADGLSRGHGSIATPCRGALGARLVPARGVDSRRASRVASSGLFRSHFGHQRMATDPGLLSIVELRRHLHRHPELRFQEHATSRFLVERLSGSGFEIQGWGRRDRRDGESRDARGETARHAPRRHGRGPHERPVRFGLHIHRAWCGPRVRS